MAWQRRWRSRGGRRRPRGPRVGGSGAAALSGANEVLGAIALVSAIAALRAGWLGAAAGAGVLLPFAVAFFLMYRPLRDLAEASLAILRARVALAEIASPGSPADADA